MGNAEVLPNAAGAKAVQALRDSAIAVIECRIGLQPSIIVRIALQVTHIPYSQMTIELSSADGQVGQVDQAQPPLGRQDNIAEMQRTEIYAIPVQAGDESPDRPPQVTRLGRTQPIGNQLSDGLSWQGLVTHDIALEPRYPENIDDVRARNMPAIQSLAIVGKALGVRIKHG